MGDLSFVKPQDTAYSCPLAYLSRHEIEFYQRYAEKARQMAAKALTPEMKEGFLGLAREWEKLIKAAGGEVPPRPSSSD